MKKSIISLFALLLALSASAQVKFGVKGGLNFTDIRFEHKILNDLYKSRTGFFIGPTVKLDIPGTPIGIDVAALYDKREAEPDFLVTGGADVEQPENVKRQALNLPLNLRYSFGLGSAASVFIKAGPQFGFNLGSKNVLKFGIGEYLEDWNWADSELSLNFGGGILLDCLEISANYNVVCGKTGTYKVNYENFSNSMKNRNNAWQISAALYF